MAYDPRPFASGDTLLASRDQIRTDFEIIQTSNAVDHVDFNDGNAGKHKWSNYVERSVSDEPTTGVNESAIWVSQGASSAESEVYIRRENQTGALEVPTKDLGIYGVAAAGLFDAAGATLGTHNLNCTAVRDGIGRFTVNFTNNMPDANYMPFICAFYAMGTATPAARNISWRLETKTNASMQVIFSQFASGSNLVSAVDPTSWNIIIYGGIQ